MTAEKIASRNFELGVRERWQRARIYQIELSSFCNLKCSYCPHPQMSRTKGNITEEVLGAALSWIVASGGKKVALHHFGEPLLHPELEQRLKQVADSGLALQLSTNGVLLEKTWNILEELDHQVSVMLSVHLWKDHPDRYEATLNEYQEKSVGTKIDVLRAYNSTKDGFTFHEWAEGQKTSWDVHQCPFIQYNGCVVLWNGDLATCCVDHEGKSATGNILSGGLSGRVSAPWSACKTCDVGRRMIGEKW